MTSEMARLAVASRFQRLQDDQETAYLKASAMHRDFMPRGHATAIVEQYATVALRADAARAHLADAVMQVAQDDPLGASLILLYHAAGMPMRAIASAWRLSPATAYRRLASAEHALWMLID